MCGPTVIYLHGMVLVKRGTKLNGDKTDCLSHFYKTVLVDLMECLGPSERYVIVVSHRERTGFVLCLISPLCKIR
jgi:hypothetical protein